MLLVPNDEALTNVGQRCSWGACICLGLLGTGATSRNYFLILGLEVHAILSTTTMNRIRSSLPWTAKNVVRIVRLQGMITPEARPGGRGFNFLKVEKHIEQAFDTKKIKPKAVCLEINSRGGSPVQSSLIFHRIRALSKENDVPVLSFAEDTAASGGYWLALAGDEIFVDPNSIVGNIGALYGTFGMEETIKKLGRYIAPLHTLFNFRATYRSHAPHFCREKLCCL